MKFIKWFFKSLVIALLLLFAVNLIGSFVNINVPINVWTILLVLLLRLPGVIVLVILFLI